MKARILWKKGNSKDWIINYLTDKAKYVEIDSHMSEQYNIKCAVPNICKRFDKANKQII